MAAETGARSTRSLERLVQLRCATIRAMCVVPMASPGQILRAPLAELDHPDPRRPRHVRRLAAGVPDTNLYGSNSIGRTHNFGS